MGSYALPTATTAFESRSRSSQNLALSPDTTPTLTSNGFTNGSTTPRMFQDANRPGASAFPTLAAKAHARSPSYLAGLGKMPFRTSSADDMRRGRARGDSDLGRPAMQPRSVTAYDPPRAAIPEENVPNSLPLEILSALLIPLPFLLSSLTSPLNISARHVHHSRVEVAEEVLEEVAESAMPVPANLLALTETFALAAGTLLLVGIWGQLTLKRPQPKRRRSSLTTGKDRSSGSGIGTKQFLKRLCLRMASVALPYLATAEIGGVRTGVILLTALASGLVGGDAGPSTHSWAASVRHAISRHKWTCMVFILSVCYDLFWHTPGTEYSATFRGYIALAKSILLLAPPYSTSFPAASNLTAKSPTSTTGTSAAPFASARESGVAKARRRSAISPLIATSSEVTSTLVAGVVMAVMALLIASCLPIASTFTATMIVLYALSIASAASALILVSPSTSLHGSKIGLGAGLAICQLFGLYFEFTTATAAFALFTISMGAFVATSFETSKSRLRSPKKGADHRHDHQHHHTKANSRFTNFLIAHVDNSLVRDILEDKESRRIVYFMSINLGFMFVQTFYALVSGSLGLLSDSIHMFFDCVGLAAGLIASIMKKWPPNARFPYGYGKVETLSGLGNGIFLLIISVEIIWESFERFMEGVELKHLGELMAVSVAGLIVNLIGLFFIGHAHHGHSHDHGHGHGHSHGHANGHAHAHEHTHDHDSMMQQVADPHGHAHDHGNENMMGIYLHILADTMGSVAVIISTALTYYSGWSGWDPLASCIIAILIILASWPLVTGSARRLLLTVPYEVEYKVREALQEIGNVRGVSGYAVPRFWIEDGDIASSTHTHHDHDHGHSHSHPEGHSNSQTHEHDHGHKHKHTLSRLHSAETQQEDYFNVDVQHDHDHHDDHDRDDGHHGPRILGVIHVIASRSANSEEVRQRTDEFLRERNMHCVVQVDKEGQGRCWCGGDKSLHLRTSSIVPGLA